MTRPTDPSASPSATHALLDRLRADEAYDIVVGINTKDVQTTIIHVLNVVCEGLHEHYPNMRCLVVVSDGASEDETVPLAEFYPAPRGVDKVVVRQMGGPGKGNGVRTILEISRASRAHACAFVDGDLVSIRPIWVDKLLRPVLHGLSDLVVPYYLRDKWDGVITNHLCYPFTAALYGTSVRQPIGGEYGLSRSLVEHLLEDERLPEHFGIDIYLTTVAITEDFRLQEAPLGIKAHASTTGYADPRKTLARMYREVVGTLFDLARRKETAWRADGHEAAVLLSEAVIPYYSRFPEPTSINTQRVGDIFRETLAEHAKTLAAVLPADLLAKVRAAADEGLDAPTWVPVVYAFAAHAIVEDDEAARDRLLQCLGGLGMGRFLRFVAETREADLVEAHRRIHEQARLFEASRGLLVAQIDALRTARERSPDAGAARAGASARRGRAAA